MALKAPRPRRAEGPDAPAPATGLPPWLRHALRTALHLAFDTAAVTAAYRAAFWARFEWTPFLARVPLSGRPDVWASYQGLLYAAVPIWLVILHLNKLYTASWMSAADRFVQIFKACALGTGTTLIAAFLYSRLAYSRLMLAGVFPISLALVCASQALALWIDDWLARHESAKPVLLVGGGPVADLLRERIHDRHPGAVVSELEALPSLEELERILDVRAYYELILLRTKDARERVLPRRRCATRAA